MLSTETSMRFFILGFILAFGPRRSCYLKRAGRLRVWTRPSVPFERAERKARKGRPDRRPQPHLPGVFRPASEEHVGWAGDQRRVRVHVTAGDRPGLAAGV